MQTEKIETMNLETFNENYDLTRSGRAVPKNSPPISLAVRHTADGENFSQETNYYFFDENSLTVRESAGLVPVGEHLTGANNFKIVLISRLRSSKTAALSDGQEFLKMEIKRLSELIANFELQKQPKSRNLKDYLMGGDSAK